MTSHAKISVLLGFGLLLFMIILVTDHLSPAATGRMAPLADPVQQSPAADPQPQTRPAASGALPDPEPDRSLDAPLTGLLADNSTALPEDNPVIEMRLPSDGEAARALVDLTNSPPLVRDAAHTVITPAPGEYLHHVRKSETLYAITLRYYGDSSLIDELAMYNADAVSHDLTIREGTTLRIPHLSALQSWVDSLAPSTAPAKPDPLPEKKTPVRTYTIKKGDTLSELAQQLLGSSKRWRDLQKANPTVIKNPDILPAGREIVIPVS